MIWAIQAFVSTKFRVVPNWGTQADFLVFFGTVLWPNASGLTRQKLDFADGMWSSSAPYTRLLVPRMGKLTLSAASLIVKTRNCLVK